ncbi:MAG: Rap1a/Tai family immunity protein [Massilia sp.]
MKRAALLLVACASAFAAGARQRDIFPWHLSGDDLVAQQMGNKWTQDANASAQRRYAEGYQAGVVDATQGKSWCAPDRMKPGEVDDRIWGELKKRRGAMPGSAAGVLVELYAARFPCR